MNVARRWAAIVITIAIILTVLVWGALQQRTANHFGYALPEKNGLPAYVYANGRRYHAAQDCANNPTSACGQGAFQCWTAERLRSQGEWPLRPAGAMFTLFGAPRPLLRRDTAIDAPYLVANGADCYVEYSLEGGP